MNPDIDLYSFVMGVICTIAVIAAIYNIIVVYRQ